MATNPPPPADSAPLGRLNRASALLAGLAMLAMMAAGAADVVTTNLDLIGLTSRPIPGVHECIATLMVVVVFLAIPLAQQRGAHLRVGVLAQRCPPRLRAALNRHANAAGALFFGLIAWFGWEMVAHALATGEFAAGPIDVPLWPARAALAAGATLMAAQCLVDARRGTAGSS